ncbi:NifB/NifX family molybdenum-iron cluster-binding protein [Maridesulfovibrio salexigens]|uniref:Dinitrogenase iron-molybdenum cofactor biosynthesis protein n=1 Tax=Maridesulfovibrio salexigens (strain ATCC 14822 / DSM 2638 / NCIMB 8403 / VKM B-1763) TaxID=526222 RepID=C6BSH3_MARSD|nr:NifB/NifX family molybdenum-iron cluster-binding protein [Maridesulfovibrio salexigens]ACS79649.1 Dinitrogenase iron-molybdenum cofactor biosynthesis protein [Maridesulfovibrio salexigens DSM 2638]
MLIAVSANNSNLDDQFEPRFGRAAGFVIFNSETGESRFIDNSVNAQVAGGAGLQTAQLLADQGVNSVISGTFGPKAEQALQAGHIEMVTVQSGTVRELVENYVAEVSGGGQPVADLKRSPNSLSRFGGGCRRMGGTGRGMGMAGGGRGMGGGGRGMGGGGMGRR